MDAVFNIIACTLISESFRRLNPSSSTAHGWGCSFFQLDLRSGSEDTTRQDIAGWLLDEEQKQVEMGQPASCGCEVVVARARARATLSRAARAAATAAMRHPQQQRARRACMGAHLMELVSLHDPRLLTWSMLMLWRDWQSSRFHRRIMSSPAFLTQDCPNPPWTSLPWPLWALKSCYGFTCPSACPAISSWPSLPSGGSRTSRS